MNSAQIKDLLATGGVEQATQQMQLNANYNNYLDARNWSTTELQPLLQATGNKGTPAGGADAEHGERFARHGLGARRVLWQQLRVIRRHGRASGAGDLGRGPIR